MRKFIHEKNKNVWRGKNLINQVEAGPLDSLLWKTQVNLSPTLHSLEYWAICDGMVDFWSDYWLDPRTKLVDFVSNIPIDMKS